ncbi:MAG: hypothetical protein ACOC2H_05875 [Spirochaetota bacterium]
MTIRKRVITFLIVFLFSAASGIHAASSEKRTVLFASFTAENDSAKAYLPVLQQLVDRQARISGGYTIRKTDQNVALTAAAERKTEILSALARQATADYVVFGSVAAENSRGVVSINAYIFDAADTKTVALKPVVTESGARFINGCDDVSGRVYRSLLQLARGEAVSDTVQETATSHPSL